MFCVQRPPPFIRLEHAPWGFSTGVFIIWAQAQMTKTGIIFIPVELGSAAGLRVRDIQVYWNRDDQEVLIWDTSRREKAFFYVLQSATRGRHVNSFPLRVEVCLFIILYLNVIFTGGFRMNMNLLFLTFRIKTSSHDPLFSFLYLYRRVLEFDILPLNTKWG